MPGAPMMAAPSIGAVGTPLPQTTQQGPGAGPAIRYMQPAARPGYSRSGDAFGATITQPLSSAPGYLRGLWITVQASGGTGTSVTAAADGPYNVIQYIQMRDAWGTPVISMTGYELAKVLNPYSGQCGMLQAADPAALPSFSAVAGATGNFTFRVYLPLEAVIAYGVMAFGNASVLPTLFIQYAPAATVYGTVPTTAPTIALTVDEDYYDIDPTNPVEPPANGTSLQWSIAQGDQPIGSASSTRVKLPHLGGYLTTLAIILRDSTGARTDAFNSTGRVRLYFDGVPQLDELFSVRVDKMFIAQGGGYARPTGVLVWSFKNALSQLNLGLLDSLENAQQATPGTQIEVEMTPWGSPANAPYTCNVVYGQIVPAGPIMQGLFET